MAMDNFDRDIDGSPTERTKLLSEKEEQGGGFDVPDGERLLHILVRLCTQKQKLYFETPSISCRHHKGHFEET